MPPQVEEIKTEIENSLRCLSEHKGDEIANRIRPILYSNLDRGRVEYFIDGNINHVHEYVWRVAEKYIELSPLINKIQREREPSAWKSLSIQMLMWAYTFFLGKGFRANSDTEEIAKECTNEAAINVLRAHFPYDTNFDPWAYVIVQNTCRKYIRRETKKTTVPQQSIIDIDDALSNIEDPTYHYQEYLKDLRGDLFEAVNQLSKARRLVIELTYFGGQTPVEIAKKMGKSVGAIHNLKFNALLDLRKIMDQKRNILNG